MSTYARISGGAVAEVMTWTSTVPLADAFHPAIVWVQIDGIIPAPKPGWAATESNGNWTFTAPSVTAAQTAAALVEAARVALDASDTVILRAYEAGVAVPQTWQTYRSELRLIVSGGSGAPSTLPTMPPYPSDGSV